MVHGPINIRFTINCIFVSNFCSVKSFTKHSTYFNEINKELHSEVFRIWIKLFVSYRNRLPVEGKRKTNYRLSGISEAFPKHIIITIKEVWGIERKNISNPSLEWKLGLMFYKNKIKIILKSMLSCKRCKVPTCLYFSWRPHSPLSTTDGLQHLH